MQRRSGRLLTLALLATATGWSDVTVRHTLSFQFASFVPDEMRAQAEQQFKATMPTEMIVRIKGDKAYTSVGPAYAITDYGRREITLLNPKAKQYATIPLSEYGDRLAAIQKSPAVPAQAQQMLQSLRMDVQSKKTGQTGLIEGIRAEENLIVVSMQMPSPQADASMMRMEMRCWLAQPDEIRRIPALKELADYTAQGMKALDPTAILQKGFAQTGVSSIRPFLDEIMKLGGNLMLKMQMGIHIPGMVQMFQLSRQAPAGLDPNAPVAEEQINVAEISTAPIPDSAFEVPADYKAAAFEDLAKAIIPTTPLAPAAAPKTDQ